MKAFTSFILLFLFISCDKKCEDNDFKIIFFTEIELLEGFISNKHYDEKKVIDAVSYLNAVTGIQSNINLGDIITYSKGNFRNDKREWVKWYDNNKCIMSITKADSLYNTNTQLRPNFP